MMMKLSILLSAVLLLTSQSVICQPKVELPEGFYINFGDVLNLKPAKRAISVINSGTDTLIISNVGASCGCTALLLSDDKLSPHDSASLMITLDARQFTGVVEKLISFNTNDKDHPLVEVKFSANIISILQVEPEYIFIKTAIGSPVTRELIISNISDEHVSILSVNSGLENLSFNISDKQISPGDKTIISVLFESRTTGTLGGDITISTDHPLLQNFDVRFHSWTSKRKELK